MKYEYYIDHRGEWRWRCRASNGETIAVSSEAYVSLPDCLRGIELMQQSRSAFITEIDGPDAQ